jgi:hypothetical protein
MSIAGHFQILFFVNILSNFPASGCRIIEVAARTPLILLAFANSPILTNPIGRLPLI